MPAFSLLTKTQKPEDLYTTPSPPPKPTTAARRKAPPSKRKKATAADHSPLPDLESTSEPVAPRRSKRQPVTKRTVEPLPTPPSTASTTTSTSLTCTVSPLATLSILGEIISDELTHWMHHTSIASTSISFAALTTDSSSTASSAQVKVQALQRILETLPLRYKALALSYSDPELIEPVVLSAELEGLLDSLQSQEESIGGELEGWYDQKLFQSKKFRPNILNMEDEIRRLEEARMEELKGLMLMVEEMKLAAEDALVGDEALKTLVEAMDEAGLSAAGLRPTRAASTDSWAPEE